MCCFAVSFHPGCSANQAVISKGLPGANSRRRGASRGGTPWLSSVWGEAVSKFSNRTPSGNEDSETRQRQGHVTERHRVGTQSCLSEAVREGFPGTA